jgi:iron complex transport system permease protein
MEKRNMSFIENKRKYRIGILILLIVLFVVIIFSCSVGAADIAIADAVRIIFKPYKYKGAMHSVIWNIRMPRVLLSVLVGSSLSVAGVAYQGLFRNPMAEPYILGISAGAAFGGTLSIVLGITNIIGIGGTSAMSFLGAVGTTFLVYNLGSHKNRISMTYLLLSGIAISSLLSALISLIMIFNREKLNNIIMWTMGSFTSANWSKVIVALISTFIGASGIYYFAKDLNLMLLGEENAQNLGINIEKTKKILLILASLISAIAVSVSGIIGFVGLIVPHAIRLIAGPDHRVLIPCSVLAGGIFLAISDTLARILAIPMEIPVGVITAVFGAPFFIHLLIKSKRSSASI